MFGGLLRQKENILYVILTIFLLERVRHGWNRIKASTSQKGSANDHIERRQQTYLFGAASLYALPFLLPLVRYVYRSVAELEQFGIALQAFSNVWALALVALCTQAFLSIVIYNLLGIYIEQMNRVTGVLGRLARNVVATPKLAVEAGASAGRQAAGRVRSLSNTAWTTVSRSAVKARGIGREGATAFRRRAPGAISAMARSARRMASSVPGMTSRLAGRRHEL